MKVRLLLILAGLAVVLGFLILAIDSEPTVVMPEVGARNDPLEREAGGEPETPRSAPDRAAIGAKRDAATPAPGFPEVRVRATGSEKVLVRVHLAFAGERTPSTSGHFHGEKVELQTWIEETDETSLHEVVIDEHDVAELEFPGAVHLDWVRFEPQRSSGLSLSLDEHHLDLEPGSLFELTLRLGPGAEVTGRVLLEDGWPPDGVTVRAYYRGSGEGGNGEALGDRYPGHAEARTMVDGGFVFPSLQPGSWSIVMTPPEWLQLDPPLHSPDGRGKVQLEPGKPVDVGELRVTRLHRFNLRVVDAAGNPAADMWVRLEPLGFRSPHLTWKPLERKKPDPVEVWLREETPPAEEEDEEARIQWPYRILEFQTDEQGEVECRAIAGEWELSAWPDYGSAERIADSRIAVPCGNQTLALRTVLADFEGVVVDEAGRPVQYALITAMREDDEISMMTDAEGSFRFSGLYRGSPYELRVEHLRFVPETWSIRPGDPKTPHRFELDPAVSLTIRAVDPAGEPLPDLDFRLIAGSGPRLDSDHGQGGMVSGDTDHRGILRIYQLLPGEYELGLYLPDEPTSRDPLNRIFAERRLWQKWSISTDREEHVLTVDLAGYRPPADPVYVEHRGVVRDAHTGLPVAGAEVFLKRGKGAITTRTGKEGEFGVSVAPGVVSISVLHEHYLPLVIDPVHYSAREQRHDLSLQPGGNEARITIRGKDGGSLPDLRVRLSAIALVRLSKREPRWRERPEAPGGVLRLGGLPAGPLTLTVALESIELGEHTVEISPDPGVQEIDVALEETAEEVRAAVRREWGLGEDG